MPLHVVITINDRPHEVLTIGRVTELKSKDDWHPYLVTASYEDGTSASASFNHLYREGAEECVRRALEALANNRDRRNGSPR